MLENKTVACREDLSLRLGSLLLDAGQREDAVQVYQDEVRAGNLVAADRLDSLGVPYTIPWTPVKLVILPDWPTPSKRPAVYGLSLSPIVAGDSLVAGVQAGIGTRVDRLYGIQAAFFTVASRVNGAQIGLVLSGADAVHGLQVAPIALQREPSWGLQIGAINFSRSFRGVQIAANNRFKEFKGLQIGVGNGVNDKYLPEYEGDIDGVQIGVMNAARRVHGLQFGLLNFCASLKGVQLGFSNYVSGSAIRWLPFLRFSF
jgi:hypothetical protein